jgi:HlyD family secretion protein
MKRNIFILLIIYSITLSCGKKIEETVPVRKDMTETVFASGFLEAEGTYSLTALNDGYLKKIYFNEGDLVNIGNVLAIIDNQESRFNNESAEQLYDIARQNTYANAPLLLQAKNNLTLTKQKLEQGELQEKRYKKLLETNSISKLEYETVFLDYQTSKTNYLSAIEAYKKAKQDAQQIEISNKAAKSINSENLKNNQIKAVVSGKIYEKFKQQGDYVKRGDVIATIGNANSIYAKVNVDESNIGKIKVGQKAFIQLNTNKNNIYNGVVSEIYPAFNEATQSFFCKIAFEDQLDFKVVKTQLQTNIVVGIQKNALVIPKRFIDFGGFVQIKGEKEKTKVQTNFVSNEWVQIVSGITDTTILITEDLAENKVKTSEVGAQMRH